MMDMDDIDLSEIDPVIPDPDFFEASTSESLASVTEEATSTQPPVTQKVLDYVQGAELKYDDELCEFDEFLVGFGTKDEPVAIAEANAVNGDASSQETLIPEDILKTNTEKTDDDGKKTTNEEELEEDDETASVDCNASSNSGPNSPDSKVSSTVVRLSVPVVANVSRTKKPVDDQEASPSRRTRSKVDSPKSAEVRTKRKISSSSDSGTGTDSDADSEEDDLMVRKVKPARTTRRPTRKMTRYGQNSEEEHEIVAERSRRPQRRVARYGFDDDDQSENDSDPQSSQEVKGSQHSEKTFKTTKKQPNYRIDRDNVIHYNDGSGNIILIHPAKVHVTRISKAYIAKFIVGEESDIDDEDDDDDNPFLLEVCIDNFHSAEEAVTGGANRIELCYSLSEGGLTPSGGFLTLVKEKFKDTPVFVMIRPRGGDFVYTPDEIEIMSRDISHYKQMGADGFVFGILTNDCNVDVANCRLLKDAAFPLECTFHRAFDKVADPFSALETIISLGFSRILTSGQAPTAEAGIPTLKRLVKAAGSRITILAGAGVNNSNVGNIVKKTGVKEVHGSASKEVASRMCKPGPSKKRGGVKAKSNDLKMGSVDDSIVKVTDSLEVAQIIKNGKRNVNR